MRALVCGGRKYANSERLFAYLDSMDITEVIHGGAKGADALAGEWAQRRGIKETVYAAQWERYGRRAGVIRNIEMLQGSDPDVVIAFSGGPGTAHMKKLAKDKGYRVLNASGDEFHPPWEMQLFVIEEEP